MSFEPGSPVAEVRLDPPKSGKKKFLLGGCGCLGILFLLCAGGGGFVWFTYFKPLADFTNEAVVDVRSSEVANEALGAPVKVGAEPTVKYNNASIEFEFPVSGSKASGTMVMKGTSKGGKWIRDALYLEIDGNKVELNPEEEFSLDIDDGSF
jgi:hypothetical protein